MKTILLLLLTSFSLICFGQNVGIGIKNEDDLYGLRYSEFVVPLVKAVQEQQAIITILKVQVEELSARIKLFESQRN